MGVVSGVVVFFIIWWTVLFAVLPWGVRHDPGQAAGHDAGAPSNPRILRKFLITTAITMVLWGTVDLLILFEVFSFRDWARSM